MGASFRSLHVFIVYTYIYIINFTFFRTNKCVAIRIKNVGKKEEENTELTHASTRICQFFDS